MKNHVLRPLWVVLGAIALLLLVRYFMVPADFGVHGESFKLSFHRLSNVDDWRNFTVKYKGNTLCIECHEENVEAHANSAHAIIQCENCHGPAENHPDNPESLALDTSRELCLRCHADLPYPSSTARNQIPPIDPNKHNPGSACVQCHNPHNPELEVG
ncbi:MAG: cytochrome c3 family protein [Proteobacteria bacterium]|nr:cytochrome c3 family protein [Pseudomonadota bacterium]MBU1686703.1 cytochrome c3 family protein [Pseudomonadota bacterium]